MQHIIAYIKTKNGLTKMIKTLLLTTLLTISVFGVEIIIDKTSQMPQGLVEKKELVLQKARQKRKEAQEKNRYRRDREKEIVIDTKLNIMWQDNEAAKNVKKSWEAISSQTAKEYCQELKFAGYEDWYLPTIKELESIVDISRYDPAIKEIFQNTASSRYWSSSPDVSLSEFAWFVYFRNGSSSSNFKTNESYVRCARAGQ